MRPRHLFTARALPRRTMRLRLTLLYATLFLLSGAGLLTITYILVDHATGVSLSTMPPAANADTLPPAPGGDSGVLEPRQADQLHALATQQQAQAMHQLLVQSGIALTVMTVVSGGLGWLVAGRVLRPLRTMTATVRDISATNLNRRLAMTGPRDELSDLGDTFDNLLGRLEKSFTAQRQFVANASHELRTPLTRQRALAQVAIADPDATMDTLRVAHEHVISFGRQQEQLIDALLILARGQAGPDRHQPIDLADLTRDTLLARQELAEQHGLSLDSQLRPAHIGGDPRLIERLVTNLVDNAIRHNLDPGWIRITTETRNGRAVLAVANSGPVIPVDQLGQLVQPFRRLGADRTSHADGHGLGLSIVDAVAATHHATVTMHARPHGGLDIEVGFQATETLPQPPSP